MIFSSLPLIIFIVIDAAARLAKYTFGPATQEIFHHGAAIFIFIFVIVAPGGVAYLMHNHLSRSLFTRFYDYFSNECKERHSEFFMMRFNNDNVKAHALDTFARDL